MPTIRQNINSTTTCPSYMVPKIHEMLEVKLDDMAPKIAEMLRDLRSYLGDDRKDDVVPVSDVAHGSQNVIILCDDVNGISFVQYMLQKQKPPIPYMCIIGNGKKVQWWKKGNDGRFKLSTFKFDSFDTYWTTECKKTLQMSPTRVVLLNTGHVAEGLNILGVELVLGLSSYTNGNVMEQAFGRADRMCHHRLFREEQTSTRNLRRKQYFIDAYDMVLKDTLNQWVSKDTLDIELNDASFRQI